MTRSTESRREPNVERLLAAFELAKLDRVPHFDYIDPANVGAILGRDPATCTRNDGLSGPDAVRVARYACMDYILAASHYHPYADTAGGRVCSLADLDCVHPAPAADYRRRAEEYMEAARGTGLGVGIGVSGPFFSSYMAMGPIPIQSFLENTIINPDLVEQLMDLQVEGQLRVIEAIADMPIAFIDIADDVCDNTGYMIPPDDMERLWLPRIEKIIDAMRSLDVPMTAHVCGKLDPVLPKLVEWGIKAIHPVQVNCNDIYAIKEEWGDRICPIGNINIQGVLPFGTPAEVETDVREHIERLGYNGGYVCGSSHSIVDAIPHDNYRALFESVVEYG